MTGEAWAGGALVRRPRDERECVVMGVVNVTEDSFSDGGMFVERAAAVARGLEIAAAGAAYVDVGGESTRPGARRVDPAAEAGRVVPVIADLAAAGIAVSVDTMRAEVAEAAVAAGAVMVNDVSGGLADPTMLRVVAEARVPYIAMHWRATVFGDAAGAAHADGDIVRAVREELSARADAAIAAGIDPGLLVLDPGLGFAKTADDNWALLQGLPRLRELGFPVLIGASRKRFLGTLLARDGVDRPPAGREDATAAITTLSAAGGAWGVRVHDVRRSLDAVAVASAWKRGRA